MLREGLLDAAGGRAPKRRLRRLAAGLAQREHHLHPRGEVELFDEGRLKGRDGLGGADLPQGLGGVGARAGVGVGQQRDQPGDGGLGAPLAKGLRGALFLLSAALCEEPQQHRLLVTRAQKLV